MSERKIIFWNGISQMFELADSSNLIELLIECYQWGLKGFKLTNGVGGYSIYPHTGSVVPAEYYYNFDLAMESIFNPKLPPQTTLQKSFPFSRVNFVPNSCNLIDISDVIYAVSCRGNTAGLANCA